MDEFIKYWKPELDHLGMSIEKLETGCYSVSSKTHTLAEFPKEKMGPYIGGMVAGWVHREIKG